MKLNRPIASVPSARSKVMASRLTFRIVFKTDRERIQQDSCIYKRFLRCAANVDDNGHQAISPQANIHAGILAGGLPNKLDVELSSEVTPSPHRTPAQECSPAQLEVLRKLQEEANKRLILQSELMQAEHKSLESSFKVEALVIELETAKRERAVLEERSERQAVTLSMMEARSVKLATECTGLRDSLKRAEAGRDHVGAEKEIELKDLRSMLKVKEGQVDELKDELERSKAELANLQAMVTETRKAQDVSSQSQALTIKSLQEALIREQEMRIDLERRSSEQSFDDLRSQLREVSLDRGLLEENLRHAVRQSLGMRSILKVKEEQVDELKVELERSTSAKDEAIGRLQVVSDELLKAQESRSEAMSTLQDATNQIDQLVKDSAKREDNMRATNNELSRRIEVTERANLTRAKARALSQSTKLPFSDLPGFSNTNKFSVEDRDLLEFMRSISIRSEALSSASIHGFMGLTVRPDSERRGVYEITTNWETVGSWEAWSRSRESRKLEPLPLGVLQFVPARGEGFPEDNVGFKDLTSHVDAKY